MISIIRKRRARLAAEREAEKVRQQMPLKCDHTDFRPSGVVYLVTYTPFWRWTNHWTGKLYTWAGQRAHRTATYKVWNG